MKIKINNQEFYKSELLKLVNKSKLEAIHYIRSTSNISLKEAKEIIENLEKNPDYFDNKHSESQSKNIERKVGSHIIKKDNKNKIWFFITLLILASLLYLLINK